MKLLKKGDTCSKYSDSLDYENYLVANLIGYEFEFIEVDKSMNYKKYS